MKTKMVAFPMFLFALVSMACSYTIRVEGNAKTLLQNPQHQNFIMQVSDAVAEVVAVCPDEDLNLQGRHGTGSFISHDGLMVTARHIVEGGCDINVYPWKVSPSSSKITEDLRIRMEIVKRYKDSDVVLLMPKKPIYVADILPIGIGRKIQKGERLWTFGLTSFWQMSEVQERVVAEKGKSYMLLTSQTKEGDSGGPIVDAEGNLVAIHIGKPPKPKQRNETRAVPLSIFELDAYLHISGERILAVKD